METVLCGTARLEDIIHKWCSYLTSLQVPAEPALLFIIIIIHLVTTMTRYVQEAKPVGVQPNYNKKLTT